MAATPSTMLPLKTLAPAFQLPDTEGNIVTLGNALGKNGLLVMFICNHCPFVKHLRSSLATVTMDLIKRGIGVVAINSNDAKKYPEDSLEKMAVEKKTAGYPFPYLFDETQAVAKSYHAACTPDFFLFDREPQLVYRGQWDDSRPGNGVAITGKDILAAAEGLVQGKAPMATQKPSIGCNIKWKPGNEPDYY